MTYREGIDDGLLDIQAFASFKSLTDSSKLRIISEAVNKIQQRTRVIKDTITIDASTLDANGAVALDRSITLPTRVTFTPTGGTLPIAITTKGPDEFAKIALTNNPATMWSLGPVSNTRRIYMTLEQNKLQFWPFQGLQGTFSLVSYAKMPIYQLSRATDTTSIWFGWDNANIGTKMNTTLIPQELEDCENAIVKYCAAQLLTFIPGWKKRFQSDYDARMMEFEKGMEAAIENAPAYPENYEPVVNYGF